MAMIDYAPPSIDNVFVLYACCCNTVSLREQFSCSGIGKTQCLCEHRFQKWACCVSHHEYQHPERSKTACCSSMYSEDQLGCMHGDCACNWGDTEGILYKAVSEWMCLDSRCSIPCDDEVPCLIACCNVRFYDARGPSATEMGGVSYQPVPGQPPAYKDTAYTDTEKHA
eukprot:TRINITY_DN9475_c0_g1_i2.p1 TRINITY_DN9475_c0_g1~~TRINITY_DN9475_c0_g1_i2.p1  ORF type:complete len:169 (+),score=16.79 TRINITY_DN9475_c0_g1_i2:116-622(+)